MLLDKKNKENLDPEFYGTGVFAPAVPVVQAPQPPAAPRGPSLFQLPPSTRSASPPPLRRWINFTEEAETPENPQNSYLPTARPAPRKYKGLR